jgi:hypothetical protein
MLLPELKIISLLVENRQPDVTDMESKEGLERFRIFLNRVGFPNRF